MNYRDKNWIDKFFGNGFYAAAYEDFVDEATTKAEVTAIVNLLQIPPGAHILDWCGGWGRHILELVGRGFQGTLLDYTKLHIQMARRNAKFAHLKLRFIEADFRHTPVDIQADFAINMFTAGIGYLGMDQDMVALRSLHAAIKPGAKILIDTGNLFWLMSHYNPNGWRESGDGRVKVLEKRQFDFGKGENQVTQILVRDDKEVGRQDYAIKIYTPHELANVVQAAGFTNIALYGSVFGDPIGQTSKRLVLIAQKP